MSFTYGQRHQQELQSAAKIAEFLQVAEHRIVPIDLAIFGGSALTTDMAVPKGRTYAQMQTIPVTYVPARNTIFFSFALAWAEVLGAEHIVCGVNAVDYSGYPDCRPEYIAAYEHMANLALAACVQGHMRITLHTPLLHLSKADIIAKGLALNVPYAQTISCYDPIGTRACGQCDACQLRAQGFAANNISDPAQEPQQ